MEPTLGSGLERLEDITMQIPDHRIKKIVKLFEDIKQWNEYHPQTPLPCGFVEKMEEDRNYLENKL